MVDNSISSSSTNNIVTFNVGGTKYQVSRSLLDQFPNSMMYKSASEQWQKDPESEIFIERDGARFKYVLDYMRDGKVDVPITETKASILAELEYFGIDVVDKTLVKYSKELFSMNGYLEFMESLVYRKYAATLAIYVLNQLSKGWKTLKPQETTKISLDESPEIKRDEIEYSHSIPEANDLLKNVGLMIVSIKQCYLRGQKYVALRYFIIVKRLV